MELPKFTNTKDVPKNPEHLEALQEDTNSKRKAYIDALNDEDKESFLFIEKMVQKLDKSNIPFMLLARPVKGVPIFWQYHKFTGKLDKFSEEGKVVGTKEFFRVIYAFNRFVCDSYPNINLGITIGDLDKKQVWATYSSQGVAYNPEVFGPPPEDGDKWKEKS